MSQALKVKLSKWQQKQKKKKFIICSFSSLLFVDDIINLIFHFPQTFKLSMLRLYDGKTGIKWRRKRGWLAEANLFIVSIYFVKEFACCLSCRIFLE